jgi:hypothetical protein
VAAFVQQVTTWNTTAGNKTAVLTPAVGALLVVVSGSSGITTDPTITDDRGGTYTKILIAVRSGTGSAIWCHVRDQLVSSAVAHTVTYAPGAADTGGGLHVEEWSGITKVGAAAVLQSAKLENQASGGTPTATFGASAQSSNPTIAAFNQLANATMVEPSGWTEQQDSAYTTPNNNLEVAIRNSGFTGTVVTWGAASSGQFCDFIVELNSSAPETFPPPAPPLRIGPGGPFLVNPTYDYGRAAQQFTISPAGATTPAGALLKQVNKPFGGAATPAGSLTKSVAKAVAGSVTPAGTLLKTVLKAVAGSVSPGGVLQKLVSKPFAGATTPSGTFVTQVVKLKAVAGATTPSGALSKLIAKALVGATTPAGTVKKAVSKSPTGAVTPSGSLTKAVSKALIAAVSPAGTVQKGVQKRTVGTTSPAGALTKAVARSLGGVSTPSGSLGKQSGRRFGGSVSPAGDVAKLLIHAARAAVELATRILGRDRGAGGSGRDRSSSSGGKESGAGGPDVSGTTSSSARGPE